MITTRCKVAKVGRFLRNVFEVNEQKATLTTLLIVNCKF